MNGPVHGMVGSSLQMRRVYEFIDRAAPSEATVLIRGESGTGKELVAQAIHRNSRRARGPLVPVNCAAIPEQLLESELFGYMRGAFSGAVADKKGKIELADGGTLFLDEIGELPLALQAKILRALEEREFERVGGVRPMRADVRVVAATNVDLQSAVGTGAFRRDLYFRLDVVSVRMPPLRERREDIAPLARHFLASCRDSRSAEPPAISEEAHRCLIHYDWPGNVRELRNAIERATVLGSSDVIRPGDLPEGIVHSAAAPGPKSGYRSAVRHFKRHLILDAIDRAGGNFTEAARTLGVNPCYLHRLVRTLDLRDAIRNLDGSVPGSPSGLRCLPAERP